MKKIALGYGIALGLLVWGVLVCLFVGGCSFLGLLLMGAACAVALYQWLHDRKGQKPWKILRLCYLAAVALLLVLAFRELTALGIAPQRLILEEQAESTQENLTYSLALLEGYETIGLVSSDYHLCRAGLMGKNLGLSPVGIPAHTTYPHLYVNYFLREIVGIWYYMLFGG